MPRTTGGGRALSRAALIFMGAAVTSACDRESSGPVAVYGPAPVDTRDAGPPTKPSPPGPTTSDAGANNTPPNPPMPVALYGVPPIDEGEGRGP